MYFKYFNKSKNEMILLNTLKFFFFFFYKNNILEFL